MIGNGNNEINYMKSIHLWKVLKEWIMISLDGQAGNISPSFTSAWSDTDPALAHLALPSRKYELIDTSVFRSM